MSGKSTLSVLQHLHRLAREEKANTHSDRECLERFVAQHDEDAFTVLVRRHGPMVLGVCRRLLHHRQDAEDAFQATFLVLARKAGSIRWKRSIGPWLHQVAYRLASKGRVEAARRREHERQAAAEALAPETDPSWREMCAVLDEELQALAEKYRAPLVLCYLEGQTRDEAAERLGWSLGTLKRRIQKGRELLRLRLTSRGVTLPAVLLSASLTVNEAGAALSSLAARSLARTATGFASGGAISGAHVPAMSLAEGMLQTMSTKVVKVLAVFVLMLSAAAGAGLWTCRMLVAQPSQEQPTSPPNVAADRGQRQEAKHERPHTDRYGDPLPPGAIARLGTLRFRHEGEATALAFSPDGRILAGLCNCGIVLWDAATGRKLRCLDMPARGLGTRPFDFSPDGTVLASIGGDKIVFCSVATGKRIRTLSIPVKFGAEVSLLRFSPDGKTLAATAEVDKIAVVDVQSGKVIHKIGGHRASIYDLAFAPDGKTLAMATVNASLQLWDVETGKLRCGIEQKPKDTFAHTVAFSPDGKLVAAGWWDWVGVYETATGKETAHLKAKIQSINGLTFTPDGKALVAGGEDGSMHIWDVAEKKQRRPISRRWGIGRALALSPDGKTVAVGNSASAIYLWDIDSGKELFTQFEGHDTQPNAAVFSPDGQTLFTGSYNQVRVWRTKDWRQIRIFQDTALSLSVTPDGKLMASVPFGKTVRVWDAASGKDVYQLKLPDTETIHGAHFAAEGKVLISLDDTRLPRVQPKNQYRTRLVVWDMATGRQQRSVQLPGVSPYSFAVAPDGRTAFVGTIEQTIVACELDHGELCHELRGFQHNVYALAVSLDGRLLLSGSYDRSVRLWEVDSGAMLVAFNHPRAITAVAFSADGRVAASADGNGGVPYPVTDPRQIRLWDVATGKELGQLQGHETDVSALAFSPDGRSLVSAMGDSTVLVWDTAFLADAVGRKPLDLDRAALESMWKELASGDAGKAHRAIGSLTNAPHGAVPFLKERLRPVASVGAEQVRHWIAELDSEDFKGREAAFQSLAQSGRQVEPALRRTLAEKPSLEMRRRVEDLLHQMRKDLPAETLRSLRAIAVLEHIGTAEARLVLQKLAGGASAARETCAAADALQRLR